MQDLWRILSCGISTVYTVKSDTVTLIEKTEGTKNYQS